jgi:hypothetical protein
MPGIDVVMTPRLETATKDASGTLAGRTYHIIASSSGSWARQFLMEGVASPDEGRIEITTEVHELEVTPERVAALCGLAHIAVPTTQISGLADGKLNVTRASNDGKGIEVDCTFSLRDGRLVDERLPRPITELSLQGRCDTSRCIIELLTGKCGTTEVQLACERAGWTPRSPLGLHAKVLGLPLDNALYATLPDSLRAVRSDWSCGRRFAAHVRRYSLATGSYR